MVKPPSVPVNVKGGVLIFCDPETYLETFSFNSKWKMATGLYPKKVSAATPKEVERFLEYVTSSQVSAIGEVGLDISLNPLQQNVDGQKMLLREIIGSSQQDLYSKNLYHRALEMF